MNDLDPLVVANFRSFCLERIPGGAYPGGGPGSKALRRSRLEDQRCAATRGVVARIGQAIFDKFPSIMLFFTPFFVCTYFFLRSWLFTEVKFSIFSVFCLFTVGHIIM